MGTIYLWMAVLLILVPGNSAREDSQSGNHNHADVNSSGDLDFVQCHHTYYQVNKDGSKLEPVSGQESRDNPSRQYLPPHSKAESRQYLPPKGEEAPAASFDQPNFLSVENTFLSPSLQKNYKSLFPSKPDILTPDAAQNVPSNTLVPTRKTNNKKHSDEDDEDNLERLCNDAFHSFLCKPIKGPRKTPTGRLRPNAVLPPDVLAGLSSFQDVARVRPDATQPPNIIKTPTTKPILFKPNPSNQYVKTLPLTKPAPTSFPPIVSSSTYRKPEKPDFPSPTNVDAQYLKPESSNGAPLITDAQTNGYFYEKPDIPFPPRISDPSNNNFQIVTQRPTYPTTTFVHTTPIPTQRPGYFYDKPRVPFPSNNIPQVAPPPLPKVSNQLAHHDCDKHSNTPSSELANPSNDNPSYAKPYSPSTQKPFVFPKQFTPKFIQEHVSKTTSRSFFTTPKPTTTTQCTHKFHTKNVDVGSSNPFFVKPYNSPRPSTESPKLPLPSNNVQQIIAQPQQFQPVTQKPSGYFYKKPAVPFVEGSPSGNNPSVAQTPRPSSGYVYDPPRIPFPSNNIAQVIAQPVTSTTLKPYSFPTTTPCQHHKPENSLLIPSSSNDQNIVAKPQNQVEVAIQPGYSYNKPTDPFVLPQPSDQNPEVQGYDYPRPSVPFIR